MNAKIVKSVVIGESFIEHRFDPFMENFEGTWIKSGHKVEFNATNEGTVCDSCLIDQFKRKKNWSAVHNSASFKTHSYQVPGITLPSDYYEWYIGRCFRKSLWMSSAPYAVFFFRSFMVSCSSCGLNLMLYSS